LLDESDVFVDDICQKLEQDLGFSFHWINKEHWVKALEWVECLLSAKDIDENRGLICGNINSYFNNLYPTSNFRKLSKYIFNNDANFAIQGFALNSKISSLRSSLGERVLTQLPTKCPKIQEVYKPIIPVSEDTKIIKLLLKSPLAVALSISGKDENIWDENNEEVRRYIRYSQQLNPEWYSEAIVYSLSKLK
jgi:hypothetical protein